MKLSFYSNHCSTYTCRKLKRGDADISQFK